MENRSVADVAWLAGLLEGEGCFGFYKQSGPIIQLQMTDLDIVIKAAKILRPYKLPPISTALREGSTFAGHKPYHRISIYGRQAIGWMLTLYPFLGSRRRKTIQRITIEWHALPGRNGRPLHKTTVEQRQEITKRRRNGAKLSDLATEYNLSPAYICRLANNKRGKGACRTDS